LFDHHFANCLRGEECPFEIYVQCFVKILFRDSFGGIRRAKGTGLANALGCGGDQSDLARQREGSLVFYQGMFSGVEAI